MPNSSRSAHMGFAVAYVAGLALVSAVVVNPSDFTTNKLLDGTSIAVVLGGLVVFGAVGAISYLISRTVTAVCIGSTLAAIASTLGMIKPDNAVGEAESNYHQTPANRRLNSDEKTDQLRRALDSIDIDEIMQAAIDESHKNLPIAISQTDTITSISYLPSTNLQIYRHTVPNNWERILTETRPDLRPLDRDAFFAAMGHAGVNAACSNPAQHLLLSHGLRISHVYSKGDGTELAQFEIDIGKCAKRSP